MNYKETQCIITSFLNHRRTVSDSQLRVGSSVWEAGGTVHPAFRIIEHASYDWWSYDFDIAVIKVRDSALLRLSYFQNYFVGAIKYSPTLNQEFTNPYDLIQLQKNLNFTHKS